MTTAQYETAIKIKDEIIERLSILLAKERAKVEQLEARTDNELCDCYYKHLSISRT